MATFTNRNINRLNLHSGLLQLSFNLGGTFSYAFMVKNGLPLPFVFLVVAAILVLRFILRPILLVVSPLIGLKFTLIVGSIVLAIQYVALAQVKGLDGALIAYILISGIGNVFYWTSFHAIFASLGDDHARGRQIGFRQALAAVASIVGPAAGGLMLTLFGPWAAFGAAGLAALCSTLPLIGVINPAVAKQAPPGAYSAARKGTAIFALDGWIVSASYTAWNLILFLALGQAYDSYGSVLAAAALAGAAGGYMLGGFIDAGNGRKAVTIFCLVACSMLVIQALAGFDPVKVVAVAILGSALGGLYIPAMMTAIYNDAKRAPCPLRYQFAAEGGWDFGGVAVCLAAYALLSNAIPLQAVLLLALPGVLLQAVLLRTRYAARA
jgi:DHA1 family inner membrane transport protein